MEVTVTGMCILLGDFWGQLLGFPFVFETKTMLPERLLMVVVSFLLIEVPRGYVPTCSW